MSDARETSVARLLIDELSAEERARLEAEVRADAASMELEAQMRETLGALQNWAEADDRGPSAALPVLAGRPPKTVHARPAVRWSLVAAAAVVVLALAGSTMHLLRQPQIQQATNMPTNGHSPKEMAFIELAWVAQLAPPEPTTKGGSIRFEEPWQGRSGGMGGGGVDGGPKGGTQGGSEGGTEGGGGGPMIGAPGNPAPGSGAPVGPEGKSEFGGAPAAEPASDPALMGFAKQFAFAFRIPERLPGGYEFVEGKPVNPRAVELVYRRGQSRQRIFLAPAAVPDAPVRETRIGGQTLRCIRLNGLCAGFSGPLTDEEVANNMHAFTRKENAK